MLFCVQFRFFKIVRLLCIPRRQYIKKSEKGITPTMKALQHFDDYYGSVFGKDWNSIRLALLCKSKKIALLNGFSISENQMEEILISSGAQSIQNFMDTSLDLKLDKPINKEADRPQLTPTDEVDLEYSPQDRFSLESFVPVSKMRFQEEVITESEYFSFYSPGGGSNDFIKEKDLVLPKHLKVISFPRADISNFPVPIKDDIGLFPMKIMDGSSPLPVIALNVQPGDEVADLCAGTGDKSLAILLSMNPKSVFLNDTSASKIKILKKTINDFIPDFFMKYIELDIQQMDVRVLKPSKEFDKILLDVPCIDDRNSVNVEDDNFFSGGAVKKRNQLPYKLRDMLASALDMLKVNGSLVYCTSTLSPVLNDGIVQEALYDSTDEKRSSRYVVNDIKDAFKPFSSCFKMDFSFRYGILVLPFLPNNYGPTYISKITRVS